jgi:hypothetical protein
MHCRENRVEYRSTLLVDKVALDRNGFVLIQPEVGAECVNAVIVAMLAQEKSHDNRSSGDKP